MARMPMIQAATRLILASKTSRPIDTYSVLNSRGANHYVMSCGHIGADLISLASVLRIPVYMHNVDRARIFRPSAWAAFGTDDLMGADFRACANFGPLY